MTKKNLSFLVGVEVSYELDRDTAWSKVGNYLVPAQSMEDAESKVKEILPDPSPEKYTFSTKHVKKIKDVYELGKIYDRYDV